MIAKTLTVVFIFSLIAVHSVYSAVTDYLILGDIGSYKFITQRRDPLTKRVKQIPGYTVRSAPGFLAGSGHFDLDHTDTTYETDYESEVTDMGVEVQVTQHAGAESDRWLLHEVEDGYRDDEMERLGLLTEGTVLRRIGLNRVFWIGIGGGSFMWISGNTVIKVSYVDLRGVKPEPLEVVQAYLQKFPSTIPTTLKLDRTHDEQWIKNEMERRLWLCDKWFLNLQMGKVTLDETLDTVVKFMGVFLDYRERYYGIKAKEEKIALMESLEKKDGTSLKNKLTTYKTWWAVNKGRSISVP